MHGEREGAVEGAAVVRDRLRAGFRAPEIKVTSAPATTLAPGGACAADPVIRKEHFVVSEPAYGARSGEGWLTFAGIMIIVAGTLNVIWGIAAIDRSGFFVGETKLIFDDLRTWGWIVVIIGGLQVLAGFGVFARNHLAPLVRGCRRRRQSDRRPDLHRGLPVLGARHRRHRRPRDLRTRRVRLPARSLRHIGLNRKPRSGIDAGHGPKAVLDR
jgi:hypothetical protein